MDLRLLSILAITVACFSPARGSTRLGGAYFVANVEHLSWGDAVDYEMRTASEFASHLLSSLKQASTPLPEALLLFVSTPAAADVASPPVPSAAGSSSYAVPTAQADQSASLKKVFQLAPSKTFFASVGDSCDAHSVKDSLLFEAEASGSPVTRVRMGGSCSEGTDQEALEGFLRSWDEEKAESIGMSLLVFCQSQGPSPTGTPADAPSEAFFKAYLHLQNTTSRFAALFVPEAPAAGRARCTRSLVEAHPPPAVNSTCGATCMTKASLWEAALVSIVLLVALVSGLCCLVDLDPPTRFEAERESS